MNKSDGWRTRKPRKRGFDDDFPQDFGAGGGWSPPAPSSGGFSPRPSSPSAFASGPEVEAVVKWFNAEKGFGFVELANGGGDAFLHISVLSRAGTEAVNPGDKLRVRHGPGQKGAQVTEVLNITPGEGPPPSRPPRDSAGPGAPRFAQPSGAAQEMRGTVKWYNPDKGFGFVTPEGGGKDVFVHATALERSSMPPLTEGQTVVMQVVQGKKGPEAASLTRG